METVIQGSKASKGTARGTVRFLTNSMILSGKHGFEEGNILAMTMTDPEAVPVMRVSSAIVTAVGGRTCHAAIVAREMQKPAVVALDSALRAVGMTIEQLDGKEIEVDGATGEVTIHG